MNKIYTVNIPNGKETTFPVQLGDKRKFVTFATTENNGIGKLNTPSKKLQAAIEASDKFKNGKIKLAEQYGEEENDEADVTDTDSVKNSSNAKRYLIFSKLATDEELEKLSAAQIVEISKVLNLEFPNWPAFNK